MYRGVSFLLWVICACASGIEIVSEQDGTACQEVQLYKAVAVFKDPSVFLQSVATGGMADPQLLEEVLEENPLITWLEPGPVQWMVLGKAKPLPNPLFRGVHGYLTARKWRAKKHEAVRELKIIPVKLCSGRYEAYRDTLGFVVESDLAFARKSDLPAGLPPSVLPNPVPVYLP